MLGALGFCLSSCSLNYFCLSTTESKNAVRYRSNPDGGDGVGEGDGGGDYDGNSIGDYGGVTEIQ